MFQKLSLSQQREILAALQQLSTDLTACRNQLIKDYPLDLQLNDMAKSKI